MLQTQSDNLNDLFSPVMGKFVAMNRKYTDEQIFKMRELKGKGVTCREVAREVGCSHQVVTRYTKPGQIEKLHRERDLDEEKRVRRLTQLNSSGKVFRHILKRPRPDNCEICHKQRNRLEWHHWDDNKVELGMWLCIRCHSGAEFLEQGRVNEYLKLKEGLSANIRS